MAKRDTFLLRIDPAILEALRRWSEDELRSVNGQIEFLLRRALAESGRMKPKSAQEPASGERSESAPDIADTDAS